MISEWDLLSFTIPYVAVSIVKIKSKNIKQSELNNVPSNERQKCYLYKCKCDAKKYIF